jgi:intracellular sulfur oxidation DsrE/DsrF family protein
MLAPVVFLIGVMLLLSGMATSMADEKKKIVLQISDGSEEKQALVLNVADNFVAGYGDKVVIEIVAFGPGLRLLLDGGLNNERVKELAEKGVKFSACRNTYRKMNKMLGKEQALHKYAVEVDGGARRIVELVEQGYILIRP